MAGLLSVNVTFEGWKELQRELGVGERTILSYQRIAQRRAALKIRGEARRLVPGKIFPRSIISVPLGEGAYLVGSNAARPETVVSIHEGRPAGQPPPTAVLLTWVKRYMSSGDERVDRIRAAEIRRAITQRGVRGKHFLTEAVKVSGDDIRRYVLEAHQRAMARIFKRR